DQPPRRGRLQSGPPIQANRRHQSAEFPLQAGDAYVPRLQAGRVCVHLRRVTLWRKQEYLAFAPWIFANPPLTLKPDARLRVDFERIRDEKQNLHPVRKKVSE